MTTPDSINNGADHIFLTYKENTVIASYSNNDLVKNLSEILTRLLSKKIITKHVLLLMEEKRLLEPCIYRFDCKNIVYYTMLKNKFKSISIDDTKLDMIIETYNE